MMNLREYRRSTTQLADFLPWAALVDEGIVLNKDGSFQRTAKFRGPDLDSAVPAELVGVAGRLNNAMRRLGSGWAVFVEAQRNPAAAKAAWDEIAPALDVLEIALGKARWLAGSEFSIADLNVAAAMVRALSFDLGKWPKVHEWLHRCWDRPAGKRALAMRE